MNPWGAEKRLSKEMVDDFHYLFFETEQGDRVLQHLGERMFFFTETLEPDQVVLRNMFTEILVNCGVWVQPNGSHILKSLDEKDNWLKRIGKKLLIFPEKKETKGRLNKLIEAKYG